MSVCLSVCVAAARILQVIQLHNAFLAAALECSLLQKPNVVQHIHNLLLAAKELSKMVESCSVQQSGAAVCRQAGCIVQCSQQHNTCVVMQFCHWCACVELAACLCCV
jgi:hypothetical protein